MLLDTSAEGDLLANVGAGRADKDELGSIVLHGDDLGTRGGGANVDHDEFVLSKLGDLGLLAIGGSDTEQTTQQVEINLDFAVNFRQSALETQDETNQTIGTAEGRVDAGTNTNQTTRNGVLEVVGLGVERDDATEDGCALQSTAVVTRDDSRSNLNLVAELDDAVQDGTTSNTALEVVDLGTRLVDVKGSNDNHVGVHAEVSRRNGDGIDDGFVDGVDVELELGGDRDDGGLSGDSSSDELEDRLILLLSGLFSHQVDLVLQDNDLVQLHNLNSSQMLRGLGLRARLIASNQEQSGVHDCGTGQHGTHENIVTRAIDESDCSREMAG